MIKSKPSVFPATPDSEVVSPELQAKRDELKRLKALSKDELLLEMETWDDLRLTHLFQEIASEETLH